MEKTIKNVEDLYAMLDSQFRASEQFWDPFYSDRERPVPFFHNKPDENLQSYLSRGLIQPGRAMELGCGPGRNAIFLHRNGFKVDAFDISQVAIDWAKERASELTYNIHFQCQSVFELKPNEEYDLVYDSGCLHGILPHRRIQYLKMIYSGLKPGGYFGLTCFAPGFGDVGGPEFNLSDWDVYEVNSMKGGLAFTEEKIRYLLSDYFECIELRMMNEMDKDSDLFGVPFLWTSLWRKK
ncbi:class I SAM-dependent methyltransferase [Paenibacillus sp. KQZ6P-2]|uniref:Class I SAM-dependent methyltransferase n=1 Tax=Paenibacillus mangrovi TaxID=2931978 RepID=A0A9X2B0Z6_9BACL|nr:class I SAM-dependent methyltransferase [Paenibacillus mangrovi]MCJ8010786.1 class I SAM-dependent methyltransferase [Paenibacillus mangrovi]